MATIKFQTNVAQELRLRSLEGMEVDSQFGGKQHLFSCVEGAFYVSETVGRILSDQFKKLRVTVGEPIDICKQEVSRGNGRKGIEWTVSKVGAAVGEQGDGTFAVATSHQPPSKLEQQLAASIEQAQARKAPAKAVAEGWQTVLLAQTNAIVDCYAAALAHAGEQHGNSVKPDDVRSILLSAFINLSKSASNGGRNAA